MHNLYMDINGLVYLPVDSTLLENPFVYKLVPCQHFLQGMCKKSDTDCKFSHGSMSPLPTYIQPQTYCYDVSLDPATSRWIMKSISDSSHSSRQPQASVVTDIPFLSCNCCKQSQTPFGFLGSPGILGARPAGFPPVGRQGQGGKTYQGRAKATNSSDTYPQQPCGNKRRGKKQLATRQGIASSQADVNPAQSVSVTPDNASLVSSFKSMTIQDPDSDASSVSSWASISSKVSTSKSIPTFSHTNFPGLPSSGSGNLDSLSHGADCSKKTSETTSTDVTTSAHGAWALGGPQKRFSPTKVPDPSLETKTPETSVKKK